MSISSSLPETGCQPKNRGGKPPKMDGENNGKPYEQMDDLGFFTLFLETPNYNMQCSGQIITTSAEVTLNGGLIRELPQNPLNSGLGIILICPECLN